MTPDQRDQLAAASRALDLQDIVLFDARFERPMSLDALNWSGQGQQQFTRAAKHFRVADPSTGDATPMVVFEVMLGTRVLASTSADEERVVCLIEARYLLTCVVREPIDDAALATFATLNAPHVIWPFWRQHVADVVQRGHLPPLSVPLLAGNLA
jgi:preprotein translocase subunit SecB